MVQWSECPAPHIHSQNGRPYNNNPLLSCLKNVYKHHVCNVTSIKSCISNLTPLSQMPKDQSATPVG